MKRSVEQLKHIDRTSRNTRHHQICLNHISDQKLCRELNTLTSEYTQSLKHAKQQHKLEQQRKQVLDVTIQKIAHARPRHSLSINTEQIEHKPNHVLPKINTKTTSDRNIHCENPQNHLSSSKLIPPKTSCHLFSDKCQLYPCQPVYHYRSFITRDHDQTLRQRDSSVVDSDFDPNSTYLQELFTKIEEKKFQQNRRQLAVTIHNQHHLAHQHVYMKSAKARLDEQSRLLHERLTDKRTFGYVKEHQNLLRQDIQRHLEISAKFCG